MSESKEKFFDWAYDTRYIKDRNNKIAWGVAGFFGVLATISVIAVAYLTPLKEKELEVITVDKSTGIIDFYTDITTLNWTKEEAVDYANVMKYIELRESYLRDTYAKNYEEAVKMSAGIARNELIENYAPNAPKSPILKYRKRAQVDLRFKSFTYQGNDKNIVIARYIADVKQADGIKQEHYIATVQFDYAKAETLKLSTRLKNPLAFFASNYQNKREGYQK